MSLALAEASFKGRLIGPYQRDGVSWMIERERCTPSFGACQGGFLCDEMGLGKTIEMIATMLGHRKRRTLIVAPKSVLTQWRDEVKRFSDFQVHIWEGVSRTTDTEFLRRFDVVITSYSLLTKNTPLHNITWDRIVLDEGHEIRNPKAKSHIHIRALAARIRWIVTGTPIFNSVRDFIALCSILNIPKNMVQAFTRDIRQALVLRRTKADVCEHNSRLELPPCDFEVVELDMNPEEKMLYKEVYDTGRETINTIMKSDNPGRHAMLILECLLRARQVSIWPQLYLDGIAMKEERDPEVFQGSSKKMDTLMELIDTHPKEKTLVFSHFIGEMDEIHRRLHEKNVRIFRIDGSVTKDARDRAIEQFREVEDGCVFIIQIKAGGVGLNLQDATRVYITGPAWNPATELQAIARAHRTGQVNKVTVRKLIYTGEESSPSIEESIMQLQGHKSAVCAEVLNDPRLVTQLPKGKSQITIQDIRKLFSG